MKSSAIALLLYGFGVVSGLAVAQDDSNDDAALEKLRTDVEAARKIGYQAAMQVTGVLERTNKEDFPAIAVFVTQVREAVSVIDPKEPVSNWPEINVDKLLSQNPSYWAALYEVAPSDPAMTLLHAGLLMTDGELTRAGHVIVIGIRTPRGKPLLRLLRGLSAYSNRAQQRAAGMVQAGIMRHDQKDYQGALKQYRDVLAAFPRYGFAHYEVGYSLRTEATDAKKRTEGIAEPHFEVARLHDPFQLTAYQGRFKGDEMKQMLALRRDAHPAWLKLVKTKLTDRLPEELPEQFANGLLAAGLDEYALLARQLVVARRGRFLPEDHPKIAKSLKRLAPGDVTEETLVRLSSNRLRLLQLTRPAPENK